MHLIYSAIRVNNTNQHSPEDQEFQHPDHEIAIRYEAYQKACNKYYHEIGAIQKYFPGWMPEFR